MDPAQLGPGNRIVTVVFVDIVQYSAQPVSQQAQTKARFNGLLTQALEQTPVGERVVLDTGDGAALCFLGDPEDALFAANSLRGAVVGDPGPLDLRLRIGVNLGPVRIVKDINGHTNVIGDGINVAQRVMSFAEPNQIFVSRSYYEVISRLSEEYARLFQYVGLHRDKHVREHEVYEVNLALSAGAGQPAGPADPAPASAPERAAAASAAGRFDTALLARLQTALTREIGPVAKLVVRQAAERAGDSESLVAALSEHVAAASRPVFLAGLADLAAPAAKGAASASPAVPAGGRADPSRPADPASRAVRPMAPEFLARVEQVLARHIGPLARVLVKSAARKATNPKELFEQLAAHIESPEARRAFLAEADRADR
jgi:class 3 adenylate cyclase